MLKVPFVPSNVVFSDWFSRLSVLTDANEGNPALITQASRLDANQQELRQLQNEKSYLERILSKSMNVDGSVSQLAIQIQVLINELQSQKERLNEFIHLKKRDAQIKVYAQLVQKLDLSLKTDWRHLTSQVELCLVQWIELNTCEDRNHLRDLMIVLNDEASSEMENVRTLIVEHLAFLADKAKSIRFSSEFSWNEWADAERILLAILDKFSEIEKEIVAVFDSFICGDERISRNFIEAYESLEDRVRSQQSEVSKRLDYENEMRMNEMRVNEMRMNETLQKQNEAIEHEPDPIKAGMLIEIHEHCFMLFHKPEEGVETSISYFDQFNGLFSQVVQKVMDASLPDRWPLVGALRKDVDICNHYLESLSQYANSDIFSRFIVQLAACETHVARIVLNESQSQNFASQYGAEFIRTKLNWVKFLYNAYFEFSGKPKPDLTDYEANYDNKNAVYFFARFADGFFRADGVAQAQNPSPKANARLASQRDDLVGREYPQNGNCQPG